MENKKGGIFYGWVVVAAAFIILMCNAGTSIYGFSLFVKPVTEEFGFTITSFMLGMTINTIIAALASPIVGKFMVKNGLKKTTLIGAVCFGIGFVILSFAKALPIFYVGYFFVGVGGSFTGPVIGSTVGARWFTKNRGLATGITSAGIGVGSLVIVPIITKVMQNFGISKAYLFMGILDLVVISLVSIFLLKDFPSDMGLFPDGEELSSTTAVEVTGIETKVAMKTPAYWMIGIGILIYSFAQFGVLQTQNPHIQSLGFDMMLAASVISISGIMGSVSKVFFGMLSDKLPLKIVTAIAFSLQGIGIFMLSTFSSDTSKTLLYVYCVIFGFGLGSWQPILSKHLTESFGIKYFPEIFGNIFLIKAVGDTLGPITASMVSDKTGSFAPAYIVFTVMSFVAILFFVFYKAPEKN